jgi:adenine-specific DNA-methyltransferase
MNKLSPEMPELQSMNITADNITKLKSLFPEAFNEDVLILRFKAAFG